MFYGLLIMGVVLLVISVFGFISLYVNKEVSVVKLLKHITTLLLAGLLLVMTLPSLRYMVEKEYDVVKGSCVIEIDSSGRSNEAAFRMLDTDEVFYFRSIPDLDAYGRAVPYYCDVTVSKDHQFEVEYKIYDSKSKELIQTSDEKK